jgi:hypothetical protein
MLSKYFLSFLLILSIQSSLNAQDIKKDTIPGTKGKLDVAPETVKEKIQERKLYSISQFTRETVLFVKQPLRWQKEDWLIVGGLTAGTALLTFADRPLRDATQGVQRYNNSVYVVGGRVFGEWYSITGVAAGFGLYGILAKDTAAKKISIELFQALAYSEVVTQLLKMTVGRARPYLNQGPGVFHPFIGSSADFNSFPSGHSTSAFALSAVMARHAKTLPLKILSFVPAGFTLFSRVYQDKHWVSDELIGAALGYFVGNWVVDLHESRRHRINVKPPVN